MKDIIYQISSIKRQWMMVAVLGGLLPLALAMAQPAVPEPARDTARAPAADTISTAVVPAYDVGAEVVKVLQRMKIEEPKPRFFPSVDPYEPINAALRTDKYVYDDKLYDMIDSVGAPRLTMLSTYVRRPVVNRFVNGVMLINSPEFDDNVTDWDMIVSNSRGETVRRITGGGNPPATIRWDGLDDRGSMLVTGETYNFTFYATDVSGRQLRVPGRPTRISGLLVDGVAGGGSIASVALDEIFQSGSTLLTDDGVSWLDGLGNAVTERLRSDVSVYVYGDKQTLVGDLAQIIAAELQQRVKFPSGALSVFPKYTPGLDPRLARVEARIN